MKATLERVLIVGWDGADWRILEPLLKAGQLPVLNSLIAKGVSAPLRSTIPTHSYAAWASFMTGKNPGKHGIYAFASTDPTQIGRLVSVDRRNLAGETFFEALSRHGRKVGIAHVPLSFPPVAVNGFWISGMVIPEGAGYTYPPDLQTALEMNVGDAFAKDLSWGVLENEWERLFDITEEIVEAKIRGLFYLLDRFEWDLITYVFVSPDRLQHVVMRLLDQSHPDYDAKLAGRYLPRVYEHFELLDRALGETLERVGQNTLLLLISDHGFRACWLGWSAQAWLHRRGYLKMRRDWRKVRRFLRGPVHFLFRTPERRTLWAQRGWHLISDTVDWGCTKAYVTSVSEQGVRINLQGREPFGIVPSSQYEKIRQQLLTEMRELRDPDTGRPIMKEVYLREDLFHGDELPNAPDLVFDFAPGVAGASNSPSRNILLPMDWKSGEHDIEGILVAHGPHVPAGRRLVNGRLIDIAPTVLHVLGVPVPEDLDGIFLEGLFAEVDFGPIEFELPQAIEVNENAYTEEEQDQIEKRLRSLGYL